MKIGIRSLALGAIICIHATICPAEDTVFPEQATSFEAEWESNGPEGVPAPPMQRLPTKQFVVATGIIMACWGLLVMERKRLMLNEHSQQCRNEKSSW